MSDGTLVALILRPPHGSHKANLPQFTFQVNMFQIVRITQNPEQVNVMVEKNTLTESLLPRS